MKSSILILFSAGILVFGCSKKEDTKEAEPQTAQQTEQPTPAPINEPTDLLVATDTSYSIVRTVEPVAKKLTDLTPAEQNAQFDEYGLVDMTTSEYTVQNVPLTARILRFPDDMSAYGYVAANRPKLGSALRLGSESFAVDSVLMFSDGPYVVRVTSKTMNAQSMSAQSLLAEQIASRYGEQTASPPMFLLFPFSGRTGGTNQYHPKSYLGVAGLDHIYTTEYDVSGKRATFFLSFDTTGTKFVALKDQAAKTPGTQPKAEDLGFKEGYAVRFVHPKQGVVIAGLVRGKLIGIANYNADAYQRLLTGWAQGLDH